MKYYKLLTTSQKITVISIFSIETALIITALIIFITDKL